MSRTLFWSLFAAALVAGLALRLAFADARPMHHDEANQAIRFGLLLETGTYRYDPIDHHGPTLYYLTLPVAWLRGQHTLASLDERTLRLVPALFGAATILLCALLAGGLGRGAAAASALLVAISPAFTYFSRFYIQESVFVFFALGFLVAVGRYATRPRAATAAWAGGLAGLAYATKETSVIVFAAAAAAAVLAAIVAIDVKSAARAGAEQGVARGARLAHACVALAAAGAVALVFYSSFFTDLSGLPESIRAFSIYAGRGIDAGQHDEPWYYYLRLLAWSFSGGLLWTEAFVLVLAVAGIVLALRAKRFWPVFVAVYSIVAAGIFSALRYKTPWNLLPFYIGVVVMAGFGAGQLGRAMARRPPVTPGAWRVAMVRRGLFTVVLVAGAFHLTLESWRASIVYPADPRNPYVYAQTSPDFLRLVTRVSDLAAVQPAGGNVFVKVVAGPYEQWPLPWYLRRMKRVGYWPRASDAGALDAAPVIVASAENAGAIERTLGEGYVSEFYGLRPGVLLTLFIERDLWERFLAARRTPGAAP